MVQHIVWLNLLTLACPMKTKEEAGGIYFAEEEEGSMSTFDSSTSGVCLS